MKLIVSPQAQADGRPVSAGGRPSTRGHKPDASFAQMLRRSLGPTEPGAVPASTDTSAAPPAALAKVASSGSPVEPVEIPKPDALPLAANRAGKSAARPSQAGGPSKTCQDAEATTTTNTAAPVGTGAKLSVVQPTETPTEPTLSGSLPTAKETAHSSWMAEEGNRSAPKPQAISEDKGKPAAIGSDAHPPAQEERVSLRVLGQSTDAATVSRNHRFDSLNLGGTTTPQALASPGEEPAVPSPAPQAQSHATTLASTTPADQPIVSGASQTPDGSHPHLKSLPASAAQTGDPVSIVGGSRPTPTAKPDRIPTAKTPGPHPAVATTASQGSPPLFVTAEHAYMVTSQSGLQRSARAVPTHAAGASDHRPGPPIPAASKSNLIQLAAPAMASTATAAKDVQPNLRTVPAVVASGTAENVPSIPLLTLTVPTNLTVEQAQPIPITVPTVPTNATVEAGQPITVATVAPGGTVEASQPIPIYLPSVAPSVTVEVSPPIPITVPTVASRLTAKSSQPIPLYIPPVLANGTMGPTVQAEAGQPLRPLPKPKAVPVVDRSPLPPIPATGISPAADPQAASTPAMATEKIPLPHTQPMFSVPKMAPVAATATAVAGGQPEPVLTIPTTLPTLDETAVAPIAATPLPVTVLATASGPQPFPLPDALTVEDGPPTQVWTIPTPASKVLPNRTATPPITATPLPVVTNTPPEQTLPPIPDTPPKQTLPPIPSTPPKQTLPPIPSTPPKQTLPPIPSTPPKQTLPPIPDTPPKQTLPPIPSTPPKQTLPPIPSTPPKQTLPPIPDTPPKQTLPPIPSTPPKQTLPPIPNTPPKQTLPPIPSTPPKQTLPPIPSTPPKQTLPPIPSTPPKQTLPPIPSTPPKQTLPPIPSTPPKQTLPPIPDTPPKQTLPPIPSTPPKQTLPPIPDTPPKQTLPPIPSTPPKQTLPPIPDTPPKQTLPPIPSTPPKQTLPPIPSTTPKQTLPPIPAAAPQIATAATAPETPGPQQVLIIPTSIPAPIPEAMAIPSPETVSAMAESQPVQVAIPPAQPPATGAAPNPVLPKAHRGVVKNPHPIPVALASPATTADVQPAMASLVPPDGAPVPTHQSEPGSPAGDRSLAEATVPHATTLTVPVTIPAGDPSPPAATLPPATAPLGPNPPQAPATPPALATPPAKAAPTPSAAATPAPSPPAPMPVVELPVVAAEPGPIKADESEPRTPDQRKSPLPTMAAFVADPTPPHHPRVTEKAPNPDLGQKIVGNNVAPAAPHVFQSAPASVDRGPAILPTDAQSTAPQTQPPLPGVIAGGATHAPPVDFRPAPRMPNRTAPPAAQAVHDDGLTMTVMPHSAHMAIESADGDLALHLRVREGSAEITMAGSMAPLFQARAPEARAALASEGLSLGRFDLGQQNNGQQQQSAPETPDHASHASEPPSPYRNQPGTSAPTATDGRIHVTA